MPYLDPRIQHRLDTKLATLAKLRPLPTAAVKKLQAQMMIEMTYNSNGIEGNTLTLKETYLVINEGITVSGKPLKDHLEAKNHYEALEYLFDLVSKGKPEHITKQMIRGLHQLIIHDIEETVAGKYRTTNVMIGGTDHTPPDAFEVPHQMHQLITWLRKEENQLHPVELAALLQHKFVYIHPFVDGNGRTSRLLMNVLLMQQGYPLVIILKHDRKKYYNALAQADKGKYAAFIRFIAQSVERSLDMYLKALTPSKNIAGQYLLLSQVSQHTPYSTKYLNLLARQGLIDAHKVGRNWVTTLDAINQYIATRKRERELK